MSLPTEQKTGNLKTICALCQEALPMLDEEYIQHIQKCHPELADIKSLKCLKCGLQLQSMKDLCDHLTLTMVSTF